MKIILNKPIERGNGELITELELREPTVDDVIGHGFPFVILPNDGQPAIQMNPRVVLDYVALLSGYPKAVFLNGKLSLRDLNNLQGVIQSFLSQFEEEAAPPD